MENKENELPTNCPNCGELVNYLNHKHHLYMYCDKEKPIKTLGDASNFPSTQNIGTFCEKCRNIICNCTVKKNIVETISKNTWYNFKEKQPPKDAEILVYGNKLEKYAVEYVDSEFETRKNNLNYFQRMLLRTKKHGK